MSVSTKRNRQTKRDTSIGVEHLHKIYDPILLEPIPANLLKAASELAEALEARLAARGSSGQGRSLD